MVILVCGHVVLFGPVTEEFISLATKPTLGLPEQEPREKSEQFEQILSNFGPRDFLIVESVMKYHFGISNFPRIQRKLSRGLGTGGIREF